MIKILCFFIQAFPMFFDPKRRQRNDSLFLFTIANYINFIYTWGNFDRPIKVIPSAIKVTPTGNFDRSLIQNIFKELIVTYRKGIELKANYHIVLHAVTGACVM